MKPYPYQVQTDEEIFSFPLGRRGEIVASAYAVRNGLQILEKNFRCPLGEIDLICRRNDKIIFVEVKTRSDWSFGTPQEAVGKRKQDKLMRLAEWYLKETGQTGKQVCFAVAAITWPENLEPQLKWIEDAFIREEHE
ncbi:MAG: YraN family protein [Candidatus Omnitrophica bacterium]|nr:YraN family protein [Candidatus Omnitrophota bacterium]